MRRRDSRASERDARLLSAVAPDGACSREYRQRFYRVLTRRNPRARGAETTKQRRIERREKGGESRATGAKERFFEDSPARASADVISNAERFGKDGGDVWRDDARAPARGGDAQPAGDGSGGAGSV